jgi:hypothetical protein
MFIPVFCATFLVALVCCQALFIFIVGNMDALYCFDIPIWNIKVCKENSKGELWKTILFSSL